MQRLCKRKGMYGKKRTMHRICKKAKRKAWKIWQDKQQGISFAMMGVGFLIMMAVEQSVKEEMISLQQGFWWIAVGTIPAYIGAKLMEGVEA